MIVDLSCREVPGYSGAFFSGLPGAFAVLVVAAGMAALGRLYARNRAARADDLFVGWGLVAGFMTVASVLFEHPLFYAALAIFAAMLFAFYSFVKSRAFVSPYWALAVPLGVFGMACINALGIGGYSYDDYSHWLPNALYVFQNADVPFKELPAIHSIYPGYPYALPFATYLASLLTGGFLIQGGSMFNFLLLLAFSGTLVEKAGLKKPSRALSLIAVAFMAALFISSTVSTFGMTNQGDSGTMTLAAILSLLMFRLQESLRVSDSAAAREQCRRMMPMAVAFVLVKQSNLIFLAILIVSFLAIALKNGLLKKAVPRLALAFLPAAAFALLWKMYASAEISGGEVGIRPLGEWRFDLLGGFFKGVLVEIGWKPAFIVLFAATQLAAAIAYLRPKAPWRDFAIYAALVQLAYGAFLIFAFIGSDFSEYTIRMAASFHRYMLHAGFLALPVFWLIAQTQFPSLKRRLPAVLLRPALRLFGVVALQSAIPLVLLIHPDWINKGPAEICRMRSAGRRAAAILPEGSKVGVVIPQSDGYASFIVGFEFALEEARTGREMAMVWHADRFHSFEPATAQDVARNLQEHLETNAIVYAPSAYEMFRNLGVYQGPNTGLLIRHDGEWKAIGPNR
ncbi:MAG: hypothetical protein PHE27_01345 [Alphaproteobacteria bacterium]|nr:hypothetical protein [Alphaproteobacteria bacterium]